MFNLWFSVPFEQIRQKFSGTLASLHLATGKDLERSWPRLAWPARDVFSVSSCQIQTLKTSFSLWMGAKTISKHAIEFMKSHHGILVFGRSFRDILKFVSDSSYKTLSKQIDQYLAMAQNGGTPQTYGPTYHKQKTITKNTTHQQESSLYYYKGNPSKWPCICIKFDPPLPRQKWVAHTLPETNIAPENGWLEYDRFLLGWPKLSVSGRVMIPIHPNSQLPTFTLTTLCSSPRWPDLEYCVPRDVSPQVSESVCVFWISSLFCFFAFKMHVYSIYIIHIYI